MTINSISNAAYARWAAATKEAGGSAETSATSDSAKDFAKAIEEGVDDVNATVKEADVAVEEMVETGGANLHEAMVSLEKADISARLTVKIGQKLVQAYREVSQMQV